MRHTAFAFTAILTLPVLAVSDRPAAKPAVPAHVAANYSSDQLQRLRQSLVAQIAVRDDAEQAMRAPTPQEAAALTRIGEPTSRIITTVGGGVALKDVSHMSLAIAVRGEDGRVTVTDGDAHGTTSSLPAKEVIHGH